MQILKPMFSLEICAYSVESVILAEAAGASLTDSNEYAQISSEWSILVENDNGF